MGLDYSLSISWFSQPNISANTNPGHALTCHNHTKHNYGMEKDFKRMNMLQCMQETTLERTIFPYM